MRVLIISHYMPHFPGPGAPAREFCLARELAARHELTYLLPYHQAKDHQKAAALAEFCRLSYTQPSVAEHPSLAGRLQRRLGSTLQRLLPEGAAVRQAFTPSRLLKAWEPTVHALRQALARVDWSEYDLVQVEHSTLADALRGVRAPVPKLLTWHNIHSHIQERAFQSAPKGRQRYQAGREWRALQAYERRVAGQVDRSIVMSVLDGERLRQLAPAAKYSVVPNGVSCDYFCNPIPDQADEGALVFTGLMDYEPNVEGVLFFCEQVLPRLASDHPALVFYIVGARPLPEVERLADQYPGRVVVTGGVPDVRPYLQRAALSVVPLLNGGGTRLKILEAMSMQKAVVSTSVGSEGLDLTSGKEALIADGPEMFAGAIASLLANPVEARRIAANGYQLVREHYDWKLIARSLEAVWQELRTTYAG